MRKIVDHLISTAVDEGLHIAATDEPGAGGANHEYVLSWPLGEAADGFPLGNCVALSFQNGPIAEVGVNGITNEALLAIVIDRLRSFQEGSFACYENQSALHFCELALQCLKDRTRHRLRRGVEGRNVA